MSEVPAEVAAGEESVEVAGDGGDDEVGAVPTVQVGLTCAWLFLYILSRIHHLSSIPKP